MWPAALTRLLRRRLFFLLIAIFAFIYFLTNLFGNRNSFSSLRRHSSDNELNVRRTRPIIWHTLQEDQQHNSPNETSNRTNETAAADGAASQHCRNTVQGRDLLTDDRGYVCQREHLLLSTGCCSLEEPETRLYTCETCNKTSHCCGVYEYCVSCCLHPAKRSLLELAIRTITGRQAMLYAVVEDQFELCLVKCRTNSHSVEHENKYRNAAEKYCYGPTEPHESQLQVLQSGHAAVG